MASDRQLPEKFSGLYITDQERDDLLKWNLTEPEKEMVKSNRNPSFIYDTLIDLKIIRGLSDSKLWEIKEAMISKDEIQLDRYFGSMGLNGIYGSRRLWGESRNEKVSIAFLLRSKLAEKREGKRFVLLPDVQEENVLAINEGSVKTHNPNNNVAPQNRDLPIVYDLKKNYTYPQRITEIFETYRSSVSPIKVYGLTVEIPNPEISKINTQTEQLRTRLANFRADRLEVLEGQLISSNVVRPWMLKNLAKWPNRALEERENRIYNNMAASVLDWVKKNVQKQSMHLQSQGWNRMIIPGLNKNGGEFFGRSQELFYNQGIIPTIRAFKEHFMDKFDRNTYPQTVEEASEIALEYLNMKMLTVLGRGDDATIKVIKIIKQMIQSFPFEGLLNVAEDFQKFYQRLDTSEVTKKAASRVYQQEKAWFTVVREYWVGISTDGDTKSDSFWITYTDADLRRMVVDYLDVKLASVIFERSADWVLWRFFLAMFLGTYLNISLDIPKGYTVDQIEKIAYGDYLVMVTFSHDNLFALFDGVISKINNVLDPQSVELIRQGLIPTWENRDTVRLWNLLQILREREIGMERVKKVENSLATPLVTESISKYLVGGFRFSLLPLQDPADLKSSLDSVTHWFSIYTLRGDDMLNYNVDRDVDALYSIYANTKIIADGYVPKTIHIPATYNVRNNDLSLVIPLDVMARFVPKEAAFLTFTWMRSVFDRHAAPEEIKRETRTLSHFDPTEEYHSSLSLSHPFHYGLYWCRVKAYKSMEPPESLGYSDSIKVSVYVENKCARCQNLYPDTVMNRSVVFSKHSIEKGRETDPVICQWYMNAARYIQEENKRRFRDEMYYDLYTMLTTFIVYLKAEDFSDPDLNREKVSNFVYRPGQLKRKRAEKKLDRSIDPNSLTGGMDEDDTIPLELIKTRLDPEKIDGYVRSSSNEALMRFFEEDVPFTWTLGTLQNFCSYSQINTRIRQLVGRDHAFFVHFTKILSNISRKFSGEIETEYRLDIRESSRRDWQSDSNRQEYINKRRELHLSPLSQLQKTYSFDSEAFRASQKISADYSLNIVYPKDDFKYLLMGVHNPDNPLPDSIEIMVKDETQPIFHGLQLSNAPYDLYSPEDKAFRRLFADPSDQSNQDVTKALLMVVQGSLRMYKIHPLEKIRLAVGYKVDEINSLILKEREVYDLKSEVRALLHDILILTLEYNENLLSEL